VPPDDELVFDPDPLDVTTDEVTRSVVTEVLLGAFVVV